MTFALGMIDTMGIGFVLIEKAAAASISVVFNFAVRKRKRKRKEEVKKKTLSVQTFQEATIYWMDAAR